MTVDMSGKNILDEEVFTDEEFKDFVKSKLLIFMEEHQLEKINIDDGNGRKARLSKNSKGEWCSNVTLSEKF
jgi:hypothetical protein